MLRTGVDRTRTLAALAVATGAALAGGRLAADSQQLVLLASVTVGAVVLLAVLGARRAICLLLAYLPFEGLVLANVPTEAVAGVRYAPEALAWLGAVAILLTTGTRALRPLRPLAWPLAALLALAVLSAVVNTIPADRLLIGLRAELRFLPLALIAAFAFRDGDLRAATARAVFWSGSVEAVLGVLAVVLGPSFAEAIAPRFSITIAGVEVAPEAAVRAGTISGTLNNYNHFGVVLVVALLVGLVAGYRRMGIPRPLWLGLLGLLGGMTVASGSREAVLALAAGLAVVAWRRGYRWVVAGLAIVALVVGLALPSYDTVDHVDSRGLANRWSAVLDPQTYSTDQYANFRLALLETEAEIVARRGPFLGTGPGTVVDRRTEEEGTNPLYDTYTGYTALRFNYQYDGNWGLLLLEFGVLGVAAFAWLLLRLWRLGLRGGPDDWAAGALAVLVPVVFLLGWFSAVLQQRQLTSVLFVLVGVAAAARHRRMVEE